MPRSLTARIPSGKARRAFVLGAVIPAIRLAKLESRLGTFQYH